MNKIKELKDLLSEEDNDFTAMGLEKQILREERNDAWEQKWLPVFKQKFEDDFSHDAQRGCYILKKDGITVFEFFPKSNKTFVKTTNKWEKPGLKFIIKKFMS